MDVSVLYKIPKVDVIWESSDEETKIEDEPVKTDEVTIDQKVEHVYIMNRIDDVKQWSGVIESIRCSNIGLKYYTRYPKIDHTKERHVAESRHKGVDPKLLALSKTVLEILKDAVQKSYKNILILNDTARFHSNSKLLFKTQWETINRINPSWKGIHLSVKQSDYNRTTDRNYYYPTVSTRSDFSFILRDTVYDDFINKLQKGVPIDDIFKPYNNANDMFVVYPNIVMNNTNTRQYSRDIEGYNIITRPRGSPLISVIMTAYNSDKYIRYSIQSILNQTYTHFELIIIDDASTDKTGEIIREFEAVDTRIVYLHNNTNYGTYVSKNIGMKHSKGQYITFQDSDDYSVRNRLQLQLDTLQNGKYLACYGRYVNKELKLHFCEITLFMRRDAIDFIGYFDSVRFGADSEYRRRLELLKIPIKVLDTYIYSRLDRLMEGNNRGNPDSLTNNKRTGMNSKARIIYRKSFDCFHARIHTKAGMKAKLYYMPFPQEKRPFDIYIEGVEKSYITVTLNELDKYLYKVKL